MGKAKIPSWEAALALDDFQVPFLKCTEEMLSIAGEKGRAPRARRSP